MALRETWQYLFGYQRRQQFVKALTGEQDIHWTRVVMNSTVSQMIDDLNPANLNALEISGSNWKNKGFKSYTSKFYPEYDLCAGPLPEQYDIIIAEQVLEHVLWPFRAVKNVYQMLAPDGHFLVSTPFMLRVHNEPIDCSRWTELGLKHLLADCGFPMEKIGTGSWGNRDCVIANMKEWTPYKSRIHSLRNEPNFSVVVWAQAQK